MSSAEASLLDLFNNQDHGPSPWGLSTHGKWIDCGRKAYLDALEKAANPDPPNDPSRDNELSMMRVGLYGHKLFEGRFRRQFGDDLVWDSRSSAFNVNMREALRLYKAYHENWTSIEERWGCKVIAVELPLGESVWVQAEVTNRLGGPLTGRADAIIEVIDPDKAKANTGHSMLPGRYILDYKFSKSHGSHDATKFGSENLQAQAYMWLDVLERGEDGTLGFIFERIIGHKEITREKSYASFVVYPQMDVEARLKSLVTISLLHQENPLPNPNACVDFFGKPCFFRSSGKCPGY